MSRQRKMVGKILMAILLIALFLGMRLWYLEEQGNFHPITPGEAYRSAQMDRDELEYYIRKYGIHSIINLRGGHRGEPWYEEEMSVSRELGVRHFDLKLRPAENPSSRRVTELLELYYTAPRPVLIHCRAGADRTGLAAALWKVVIDGADVGVARKQFSIVYGHIPFGPARILTKFFDAWVYAREGIEALP